MLQIAKGLSSTAVGARRSLAASVAVASGGARRGAAAWGAAPRTQPSSLGRAARLSCAAGGAFGTTDVRQAAQLLQKGYKYLDVRSGEEFANGHAPDALNVPLMFKGAGGMTPNPAFLADVSKAVPDKATQLLVGCQAGVRSLKAATALAEAGYTQVLDVAGGYAAWQEAGLPIKQ